ncbi:GGDEF domain-containing protein [Moritella sp.]|uniref:GGDEF domain-containing protein n=1 Tax=Moritella sp. TaxID=78556 RepID=UPI001DF3F3DF|nr:GGDEF domain-containing protein [Moritella sp.]MCJ8351122.1 GGDEF domain-containing protein [Moritella sp.]NQZ41590.1 GGDEF domain-containing protein [Moritella sp.]
MQISQDSHSATRQRDANGYTKINTAMLLAFINRLLGATRGIDHDLNIEVSKLKATLERSASDDELITQIKQVERQVMLQPNVLSDTLKIADSAVSQAATSLINLLQHDPKLTAELQLVLAEPKATAVTVLQTKVQSLFCIYHSAIKNLKETNNNNIAATVHEKICDDLQRLINELDFAGGFGSNLKKIRQRLLEGISGHELVNTCLQIINNIIEGAREERMASKTFLHSIVEELNNIAYKFDNSLIDSNNINKKQISLLANLKERIDILELDISTSDNLAETKLHVQQGLEIISSSIQQQQQLLQEKLLLEQQIQAVQSQLEQLKKETLLHTQRLEAQQHKLYLDSLTQVYNRTALDERFKLEFKRWQRYKTNTTIAMIDIDHFKNINDSFGHIAGDKALKIVARALQKSIKSSDFIARFGGEEFVLLLADVAPSEIQVMLDKLRNTIKNIPFRFKGKQISITISIGVTQFSLDDKETVDPFERADKALYEAKSSGRDKVIIRI